MVNLPFTDSKQLALAARNEILKMTNSARASHVASALSVVDILATIYSGAANIGIDNLNDPERDVVILSKGHAAAALYSVLSLQGFFPKEWLSQYCANDAPLGGHVTSKEVPGVELSTGSLGHGLPYGVGIAMSKKIANLPGKVIVIVSDGECDEGTTWESALIANHFQLDNLLVYIDRNGIQSLTTTEDTIALEPLNLKWESFGWQVSKIDGHNFIEISRSFYNSDKKPHVIIAKTTKGKGVSFMENSVQWHYKSPNEADLEEALREVNKNK